MSELATVTATDLEDGQLLQVSGEIDLANVDVVQAAISGSVRSGTSLVVLDLSGTTYLDSTGLAMIFRFAERLGYRRQEFCLVVPPDSPIRRVLQLTSLDQVVRVENTIPQN